MKRNLTVTARGLVSAAASPSATAAPGAVKAIPQSDSTTVRTALFVSVAALACALIAWSLLFRLPRMSWPERVQARQFPALHPRATDAAQNPSAEEIQQRVEQVRRRMLPDRKALVPLLVQMEQMAKTEGWRMDATMKPPVGPPAGVENISRYPVVVRLQNQAAPTANPSAFVRLASLLRQLSLLERQVEVTSLSVQSTPTGITSADLELHVWSLNPDAKAAAK